MKSCHLQITYALNLTALASSGALVERLLIIAPFFLYMKAFFFVGDVMEGWANFELYQFRFKTTRIAFLESYVCHSSTGLCPKQNPCLFCSVVLVCFVLFWFLLFCVCCCCCCCFVVLFCFVLCCLFCCVLLWLVLLRVVMFCFICHVLFGFVLFVSFVCFICVVWFGLFCLVLVCLVLCCVVLFGLLLFVLFVCVLFVLFVVLNYIYFNTQLISKSEESRDDINFVALTCLCKR
jgi:hypothetical protein